MRDLKYSQIYDILSMFGAIHDIDIDLDMDDTVKSSVRVDFNKEDGIIDVDYEVINAEKRAGHGIPRRLVYDNK